MRKYQIYLRGQQKPIVITENKDEYNPDSIKSLSSFFKNELDNYAFVSDNDVIICRPSDVTCVHVVDPSGFEDQDLRIDDSQNDYTNNDLITDKKDNELVFRDLVIGGGEDDGEDAFLDDLISKPDISSLPPLTPEKTVVNPQQNIIKNTTQPKPQLNKNITYDNIPSVIITKDIVGLS